MNRRSLLALIASALLPTDASASPVARLMFVHGRGQAGQDVEALRKAWLAALNAGFQAIGHAMPPDLCVDFPFYGDVLEDYVTRANLPTTSEVASRGGTPDDGLLSFQSDIAQAVRQQLGVPDDQVAAEYGDNPKQRGALNWEWVHAILRAIDRHGGALSADALERFTRDVYLYLTVNAARAAVNAQVSGQLTDRRTVVVAHSLGTVVAYDVLRASRRALDIPLLVTVGSPLGIRAVRDQLVPIGYPPHVGGWYNAYDTRDVVALFPLDAKNFAVTPAIENYAGVLNSTSDRHGIQGYLDDRSVAAKTLDALGT